MMEQEVHAWDFMAKRGKVPLLATNKKYIAAILLLLELKTPFSNSRNPDHEKDVHRFIFKFMTQE